MKRKHYSEEEKKAVMSRYASGGEEVKSLLAEYGIPKSTFNQWLREYDLRYPLLLRLPKIFKVLGTIKHV